MRWPILLLLLLPALAQAQTERVFQTLADLDAARPSKDEPVARVLGLASNHVFSFGPKIFRYDPTNNLPTNAIRRATATGIGRRVHDWDGDPEAFGVVADFDEALQVGTDNTAAISNAIVAAASSNLKVVLPGGNILFSHLILGSDFVKIEGQGKLKTRLFSNSTNRNAILVQSAHNSFSDFSIYSTALRSNVAAPTIGTNLNGILFYDFSDGLGGGLELREMYIRGHPGSGVAIAGSMEKMYAKGVEADYNKRNGFESVQIGALGGFSSTIENCRFTDNGNAGIWLSGASSLTFIAPQAWRNGPRWNVVLTNCVQAQFINPDIEGHGYETPAVVTYGPTNTISFFANEIRCNGCDFTTLGTTSNLYVSVQGSSTADGIFWVNDIGVTNLSVEHSFVSVPTEAAGASVTLQFSPRPVGLYDKNGIGNQYIGGNYNSLFAGIMANAMRDSTIITPRVANFAVGDPTIPFAVFLSGGSGFNHGNFVRTLLSPTGTGGPSVGVLDRDANTSTNLAIEGNRFRGRIEVAQSAGARGLLFSRPDLNERFSFGVSSSGAFLYDENDAVMLWRALSSASSPAFTVGDENNTHTATSSRIRAAQRASGGTDVRGTDLILDGGAGTGSNIQSGDIVFRTPDAGSPGTTVQTLTERVRILKGSSATTNRLHLQVRMDAATNWYTVGITNINGAAVLYLPGLAP